MAYRWTNVVVGAGGYAPNIVFSPVERGLAYLRTDMGGAYRFDAKARRWVPLQDDNGVPSYMGIESIAADPRDAGTVYLAAGMAARLPAAILRSTDRGAHWWITPVPFAVGGNEPGRGLGERLAIDPDRPATLMFGSRHDGLWRSDDAGLHWAKVAGFPVTGLGTPAPRTSHGGVSFVLFDPSSRTGSGSRRIWAGVADPGAHHLYRSDDGGQSWQAVDGPSPALLAAKGAIAADGSVYVGYASDIGPSNVRTGALWRFDRAGGRDITPPGFIATGSEGAFLGVALARSAPGTVAVSTINRYRAGDTVWLSRDRGEHWSDLGPRSRRNVSATPFLLHEGKGADFGHWISGLAIDPFDARRLVYTTGATVYATDGLDRSGTIDWAPWVSGIEQTAIITLISPTGGAHLVSGFGDLAGFVHERLDRSPQPSFTDPYLSNTNTLDYAGTAPLVLVRSGSLYADRPRDATLGWSGDGGRSWRPLVVPPMGTPPRREDLVGEAAITVSADGGTFVVATPEPRLTRDRGRSWQVPEGLPGNTRAVADKVNPARFYAVDVAGGRLLASTDGARHFTPVASTGLPADLSGASPRNREAQSALVATPGVAGELWLRIGPALYRSTDFGHRFARVDGGLAVELLGLGKGGTIFAVGTLGQVYGIWRSDDLGRHWARIDDDAHRWGRRYRVIAGDPRITGRVYLGTDGRGLFYGDRVGESE
ncbi:sialidase family protein [Sphingomonas sp. KR1UV-12]|uniref:Sialidase family protein n=1 Tax=Sphingomonas aurea TaxID=3063994 RepID=A0ABT9EIQ2_9SPHN|nr:sialidase family protein [Sphingomonas sp. KR1UV-12]MDP1026720.1 sialidase family protein [Sphingomonas sp. KR1UV-12]